MSRDPAYVAAVVCVLTLCGLAAFVEVDWSLSLAMVVATGVGLTPPQRGNRADDDVPLAAQSILDAAPDACVLLRMDGMVMWANQAAREQFGFFRADAPFTFTLRVPELIRAVDTAVQSGAPTRATWSEKVPTNRWFEAFVRPFPLTREAEAPANQAIAVFIRDLTEQQRIDRMREDFVANASHELRTPLAALTGFIETLQGPAKDDPAARTQFLDVMREQADRMRRLTDDLLSLSRIEMRAHLRPRDVVDLHERVRYAVEMARTMADEANVALELALPNEPIPVRGDPDELFQVFDNLIENAIKYGGGGGRVLVSVRVEDGPTESAAIMSVQDFGGGIAPEHVPRLTERFYRVDVAQSRAQRGTGLGLAIVKHIIARHKGRLKVRSELGTGSTFSVRLPLETFPASAELVS